MDLEQRLLPMKYVLAIIVAISTPLAAQAITIDLVTVGNPNNAGEVVAGQGIFGRVTTTYRIGKTEVTNSQYVDFLNAKAATDTLGLYNAAMGAFNTRGGIIQSGSPGSFTYAVKSPAVDINGNNYTYGDKPVNFVSYYDVLRFANWMTNGQGAAASTETGAYTLLGGTDIPSNASTIARTAGAAWFLPTEDEWYKAAYYNAATTSYFDYPTSSDSTPNNNLPSADTGNSANFLDAATTTGDLDYVMTSVGAYTQSDSPYGTLDQGGGVAEWNEVPATAGNRIRRGGAWSTTAAALSSSTRQTMSAGLENDSTGFRLATSILVTAAVPGDYNNNGVVDAADYVVWRKHLNESFQLQNEVASTTPGTVTQDDYNAWRARFGNTSGSGSGSNLGAASVPEPTTCVLVVFAAMIAVGARRR
jgi:formylglycine-generating enzyme